MAAKASLPYIGKNNYDGYHFTLHIKCIASWTSTSFPLNINHDQYEQEVTILCTKTVHIYLVLLGKIKIFTQPFDVVTKAISANTKLTVHIKLSIEYN